MVYTLICMDKIYETANKIKVNITLINSWAFVSQGYEKNSTRLWYQIHRKVSHTKNQYLS